MCKCCYNDLICYAIVISTIPLRYNQCYRYWLEILTIFKKSFIYCFHSSVIFLNAFLCSLYNTLIYTSVQLCAEIRCIYVMMSLIRNGKYSLYLPTGRLLQDYVKVSLCTVLSDYNLAI